MTAPEPGPEHWGIAGAIKSWKPYLEEFDKHAWPLFQAHGYSKDAALLAWHLNQCVSQLERLGTPPDDEPWRQGP